MAIVRTLTMSFSTDSGKVANKKLAHCRSNITETEIKAAMDTLITDQAFADTLTAKKGAHVTAVEKTTLF